MISPELAQAATRLAAFIVVAALLLLLFVRPGSPQFVITVFMLAIGLLFAAVILVLARIRKR